MKRIRFTATIYKHEELDYPESAVLLPEEIGRRDIRTRQVSNEEKAKVLRLKTRLKKMGSPWERKYKREKEEVATVVNKQNITREEFKKLFNDKTLIALRKKEIKLKDPKKFEQYKESKQYKSSLSAREMSMLKNYIIID